ncbi:unnamed protein product [Closterium sp. NIES-54]
MPVRELNNVRKLGTPSIRTSTPRPPTPSVPLTKQLGRRGLTGAQLLLAVAATKASTLRGCTSTSTTAAATSTTAAAASTTSATAATTSTAATDAPTPGTIPTSTATSSASSTSSTASPAAPSTTLAPLALAVAASPTSGRRSSDLLSANEVDSPKPLGPSATATTTAPTSTAATAATATAATGSPAYCATIASLGVLAFDHECRPVQFDTWLDDLQLYLLSDSKDSVSLFDLASSAATAPPATADTATRSQWLTRDAATCFAIRNHLPLPKCTHFGQHRTAQALYDAVVACYSSPPTAALGRLLLPYLFSELSTFATVEDLVSHLRTSDTRFRATVPAEFLDRNQPPMFITLYFIVTRLPHSLRSVRDHFLSLHPTSLTVDLLEQHLLATETSAVAVGAARGTLRPPFFEGCSLSPLAPSYASATAEDVSVADEVGAASASAKRRSSKGTGGRGGGGGSGGGGGGNGSGGGGSSGGSGGSGGGGGCGTGGGSGDSGGGGRGSGGSGGSGGGGTGGGRTGPWHGGPGGGQRQQQQRRSETQSPQQLREWLFQRGTSRGSDSFPYVTRTDVRAGQTCEKLHTQHRCFSLLDDVGLLDFNAVLSAMYALSVSAEVDCYRCVPPDPGIAAAALGASESGTLPGTVPAQALHTFTLDSGASRCFFRDSTTLTPLPAPVLDGMVTTTSLGGQRVSICMCTRTGRHRATFTRWPGTSLYTLTTEPPQVATSAQVSSPGEVAASCSSHLLSHQTLVWHHRLGHPSLPRLQGMHSRCLVSGLPRSLPPLLPSPAPPCLSCVEGRQGAALHSSSFPPTTASLQTLDIDVWVPGRVSGQGRERYFLLVGDDYTQYTTVFPLRSKGEVVDTSPTLRWTGEVGDASVFRVWGSRAFVRDTSTDKLSARAIPCIFLGFVPDASGCSGASPGAACGGAKSGGAGSEGAGSGGAEPGSAESGVAEPRGAVLSGGHAGASTQLSPQQLREWLVWRARLRSGAPGAGGAGDTGAGGAGVTGTGGVGGVGVGDPTEPGAAGAGGSCAGGAGAGGAGAGGAGVGGTGVRGAGAAEAGAVDPGAGGAGGSLRPRLYFVPLLQQVLGVPSSPGLTLPLLCPPPDQSQPPL